MRVGLALRWDVIFPRLVSKIASDVDESGATSVWFPSISTSYDVIDLCGNMLGMTRRIDVGTGVIRLFECPVEQLIVRSRTLTELSSGRFILGVGTGLRAGGPAIADMLDIIRKFRVGYTSGEPPRIFFSALRGRMLRAAFEDADGVILNFCSPSYISHMIPKDIVPRRGFELGCYVKLYFAPDSEGANKALIDGFMKYDLSRNYHRMFEAMGVADTIQEMRRGENISIAPGELLEIALANPDADEIIAFLQRFHIAGVNLPIIYPIIAGDQSYKMDVMSTILQSIKDVTTS